jgi:hypothetical protein
VLGRVSCPKHACSRAEGHTFKWSHACWLPCLLPDMPGLKDGEAPAPDDAGRLVDIVVGALPAAGREVVTAAVAARPQRAGAYL